MERTTDLEKSDGEEDSSSSSNGEFSKYIDVEGFLGGGELFPSSLGRSSRSPSSSPPTVTHSNSNSPSSQPTSSTTTTTLLIPFTSFNNNLPISTTISTTTASSQFSSSRSKDNAMTNNNDNVPLPSSTSSSPSSTTSITISTNSNNNEQQHNSPRSISPRDTESPPLSPLALFLPFEQVHQLQNTLQHHTIISTNSENAPSLPPSFGSTPSSEIPFSPAMIHLSNEEQQRKREQYLANREQARDILMQHSHRSRISAVYLSENYHNQKQQQQQQEQEMISHLSNIPHVSSMSPSSISTTSTATSTSPPMDVMVHQEDPLGTQPHTIYLQQPETSSTALHRIHTELAELMHQATSLSRKPIALKGDQGLFALADQPSTRQWKSIASSKRYVLPTPLVISKKNSSTTKQLQQLEADLKILHGIASVKLVDKDGNPLSSEHESELKMTTIEDNDVPSLTTSINPESLSAQFWLKITSTVGGQFVRFRFTISYFAQRESQLEEAEWYEEQILSLPFKVHNSRAVDFEAPIVTAIKPEKGPLHTKVEAWIKGSRFAQNVLVKMVCIPSDRNMLALQLQQQEQEQEQEKTLQQKTKQRTKTKNRSRKARKRHADEMEDGQEDGESIEQVEDEEQEEKTKYASPSEIMDQTESNAESEAYVQVMEKVSNLLTVTLPERNVEASYWIKVANSFGDITVEAEGRKIIFSYVKDDKLNNKNY